MYDRILFPTDGSDSAASVFEYALDVASAHDATVHVLNVADTTRDSVLRIGGEVVDVLEREGERIVSETAARAAERGVPVVTDVRQGDPSETVVAYAADRDVDLVVMPTHGREGLERVFLGSVTERVVDASAVPVLTVTPDADRTFDYPAADVLVPTDGSPGAEAALREGIDVAGATDATLHLLHVVETAALGFDVRSALGDQLDERGNEILASAADVAGAASLTEVTTALAHGWAYREILSYVEDHDVGLVVAGTRGKTDFSRYTLGGVSSKLIRSSPAPVMVVRPPDEE